MFVYSAAQEKQSLKERFDKNCMPLYRSSVRVDGWGAILIPMWSVIKNENFKADDYIFLSSSRAVKTGMIVELRINEIKKDEGGVETAIRMVQHILEGVKGREGRQAEMVLIRSNELIGLFEKDGLSSIELSEREALQQETREMLAVVELDPERVMLEEKERAARWLEKASLGKDSIGRDNFLITMGALFAARRRAWERKEGLEGFVVPKYAGMLEVLIFARAFDREVLIQVKEDLRVLAGVKYIQKSGYTDRGVGYTMGKVGSMAWLLTQTKVKPYKPMALATSRLLADVRGSLGTEAIEGYQEKIVEEQAVIQALLERYKV